MSCCKTLVKELPAAKGHCHPNSKAHSENGKRIEISLGKGLSVCKIIVDGGLIASTAVKKCDCAFYICPDKHFIFVELKGINWPAPYDQVKATINYFNTHIKKVLPKATCEAVIVKRSNPKVNQQVRDAIDEFKRNYGLHLTVKSDSHTHKFPRA